MHVNGSPITEYYMLDNCMKENSCGEKGEKTIKSLHCHFTH